MRTIRTGIEAKLTWTILCSAFLVHAQTDIDLNYLIAPTDESDDNQSVLMDLPFGLHRVEPESANIDRILIAIHDTNTTGFEWIRPLQLMDDKSTESHFVRWNPSQCPRASIVEVRKDLESLLESNDSINSVTMVGHGLGGVYLSQFTREWKSLVPIDVHVVAAPLRGTVGVFKEKDCGEIVPQRLPPTIRFFQWRTATRRIELIEEQAEDPQEIELDGSLVISLPEKISDKPVNHVGALEIVATRIQKSHLEAKEHKAPAETSP